MKDRDSQKVILRSYQGHQDRSSGDALEITLAELVELNSRTVADSKSQLPMLGGTLLDRVTVTDGSTHRKKKVPLSFTAVFGDHDSGTVPIELAARMMEASGVTGVVLETASSTPDKPRWRVVVPTSKPLDPSVYGDMVSRLNTAMEGSLSPESWSAKQGYYYGHLVSSGRKPRGQAVSGAPLDLLDLKPTPCTFVRGGSGQAHPLYAAEFDAVGPEGGEIKGTERPSLERSALNALRTGENLHSGILAATSLVASGEWPEQLTLDAFQIAARANRGEDRAHRVLFEWREALAGARSYAQKVQPVPSIDPCPLRRVDSTFSRFNPIEWTVDGFLAWGITVIAGAPGVGKTSQIVSLAMLVAHLCPADHPMRPVLNRRIIYITEDSFQVESILVAACKLNSIPPSSVRDRFLVYEAKRLEPKTVARIVADLSIANTTELPASSFQIRPLVILDTSSAIFAIADENDNATAAATLAAVKQVLDGTPLWLVAHTPKSLSRADVDALTVRGAGAFEGDANATAFCFREENVEDKRFMKLGKVRYDPAYKELMFTSEVHVETVPTPWGKDQTIRARVSYPEVSSSEEREIYKEAAKQSATDERNQEVTDAIIKFLTENGPQSKNAVEKAVQGKASHIRSIIAALITSGVLEIKGSGNKQRIQVVDTKL